MTTTIPASAAALPQTDPAEAARVLSGQLRAYAAQLRALSEADWTRPTDCSGWDVRAIAAHVTGALDEGAHLPVLLRHMRRARKQGGAMVDALNEQQIADRSGVPGPRLVEELERLAPKAIKRRRTTPRFIRARRVPGDDLPAGSTFGYLFDVIFARDVWMHRLDTARATGTKLTAEATDGEVVSQVVRDLARLWTDEPWVLELTGATTTRWLIGNGEPVATVRADTVEYLRLLSGRDAEPPVLVDGNEAAAAAAAEVRVVF